MNDKIEDIITVKPPEEFTLSVKKGTIKASLNPLKIRLIKYTIKETQYVLGTTLLSTEKYPRAIFLSAYHSRWGHEEMLKVSKLITGVQDFHAKTELGIRQELFAHFLLITLQKIIERQSHHEIMTDKETKEPPKKRLRRLNPKPGMDETKPIAQKEAEKIKVNTKNCLLNFGWMLEKLLYFDPLIYLEDSVKYLVTAAKKIYQKLRPGRSYPRARKKPASKWTLRSKSPLKMGL